MFLKVIATFLSKFMLWIKCEYMYCVPLGLCTDLMFLTYHLLSESEVITGKSQAVALIH